MTSVIAFSSYISSPLAQPFSVSLICHLGVVTTLNPYLGFTTNQSL